MWCCISRFKEKNFTISTVVVYVVVPLTEVEGLLTWRQFEIAVAIVHQKNTSVISYTV